MFPEYQDDAYNFDSRTNFKEELWGFQPAVAPHSLSRIVFPPKLPGTRVPQSEDVLFFNNNKINRVGGILCTTNKQLQQTPSNGRCSCPMDVAPVQWTLQLLVSDAWTDCTGSLIRAKLARAGYRFACFLDAQDTPSIRIRVGQRGQGTRRTAARRGSVVAAISISQNRMRLVAR